jgi:hypothetical protein
MKTEVFWDVKLRLLVNKDEESIPVAPYKYMGTNI